MKLQNQHATHPKVPERLAVIETCGRLLAGLRRGLGPGTVAAGGGRAAGRLTEISRVCDGGHLGSRPGAPHAMKRSE